MLNETTNYCSFASEEAAKAHCDEVLGKSGKVCGYKEHYKLGWVSWWVSEDWIDNKMEEEEE